LLLVPINKHGLNPTYKEASFRSYKHLHAIFMCVSKINSRMHHTFLVSPSVLL